MKHLKTMDDIMPGRTDRSVIIGMTGCGKTTLAMEIIKRRFSQGGHVVIYDAKGLIETPQIIDKNGELITFDRVESFADCIRSKAKGIIYAPNHEELDLQNPVMFARLNDFFRWIYERKIRLFFVDKFFYLWQ